MNKKKKKKREPRKLKLGCGCTVRERSLLREWVVEDAVHCGTHWKNQSISQAEVESMR